MPNEETENRNPARRQRLRKLMFVVAAVGCGCVLAALVGIPIAELVTRRVVVAEYRRQVEEFNQAHDDEVTFVFNGYSADADHPIEYRLLPNHSRTVPIDNGAWVRNTNNLSFLAQAWQLVDRLGKPPTGFLRWICVRNAENETWYPLFGQHASVMPAFTNLIVDTLPPEWESVTRSVDELRELSQGKTWIYAPGKAREGLIQPLWVYRRTDAGVPRKDSAWSYRVNELGFRSTGRPLGDGRRILFLGDSYLFGWGVHDHESLTARIEELLNRDPDAEPIHCVNVAAPGYCAEQEFHCLTETFDRFRPDAVVVCQVRNDLEPQMVAPERPQRVYRNVFLNSWFLERSKRPFNNTLRQTAKMIGAVGLPFDVPLEKLWHDSAKFTGRMDSSLGWRAKGGLKQSVAREAYAAMRDFCRQKNCPLLIVSLPAVEGQAFIPEFNFCADQLRDWAKELEIPYHNLMPAIADLPHETLRVSERDGHMNARGLSILAEALEEPLREYLRAPKPD